MSGGAGGSPWLEWARTETWRFESYYKYAFTFGLEGAVPDEPGGRAGYAFKATVTAGGDSGDTYRYGVTPEMTWSEIADGVDWTLTVRSEGGVIFSTDPCLMPGQPEGSA